MGNHLVHTGFGPQPLGRMIRLYRADIAFARWSGRSPETPRRRLREIIARYREQGPYQGDAA